MIHIVCMYGRAMLGSHEGYWCWVAFVVVSRGLCDASRSHDLAVWVATGSLLMLRYKGEACTKSGYTMAYARFHQVPYDTPQTG